MADPDGSDLDEDLALAWLLQFDFLDRQRSILLHEAGRFEAFREIGSHGELFFPLLSVLGMLFWCGLRDIDRHLSVGKASKLISDF